MRRMNSYQHQCGVNIVAYMQRIYSQLYIERHQYMRVTSHEFGREGGGWHWVDARQTIGYESAVVLSWLIYVLILLSKKSKTQISLLTIKNISYSLWTVFLVWLVWRPYWVGFPLPSTYNVPYVFMEPSWAFSTHPQGVCLFHSPLVSFWGSMAAARNRNWKLPVEQESGWNMSA